jgi:hypothetical protein
VVDTAQLSPLDIVGLEEGPGVAVGTMYPMLGIAWQTLGQNLRDLGLSVTRTDEAEENDPVYPFTGRE